jgi:hypothetical protein
MPKKMHFEREVPDTLVDALPHNRTEVAETIKAAAVLDWVRTHALSLRALFCRTQRASLRRIPRLRGSNRARSGV